MLLQRSAYLSADERLFSDFTGSHASGCTALTALVWGRHLAVAHAGDSRAVLCRRGKTIELTHDHKPTLSSERERVYTAGGGAGRDLAAGSEQVSVRACQPVKGSLWSRANSSALSAVSQPQLIIVRGFPIFLSRAPLSQLLSSHEPS